MSFSFLLAYIAGNFLHSQVKVCTNSTTVLNKSYTGIVCIFDERRRLLQIHIINTEDRQLHAFEIKTPF